VAFRSWISPGYEEKEEEYNLKKTGVGREGKVKEHRKGVAWEVAEFIIRIKAKALSYRLIRTRNLPR
jgi:hypothetical protein